MFFLKNMIVFPFTQKKTFRNGVFGKIIEDLGNEIRYIEVVKKKGHSFLDDTETIKEYLNHIPKDRKEIGTGPEMFEQLFDNVYFYQWDIIEPLVKNRVRYILNESGGGYTNSGFSRIVCGLEGEPLKPLFIKRKGHLANNEHCYFGLWEGKEVIMILTEHIKKKFDIQILLGKGDRKDLIFHEIWSGRKIPMDKIEDVIPSYLDIYREAIRSSVKKSLHYHCREPYYILTD